MDGMVVVGPPAPRNQLSFGGQSQYITSRVFVSLDTSCLVEGLSN
jgi:hypothetical protein